jgi:ABC-type multidrug transport system fused ATPase/permease subunit
VKQLRKIIYIIPKEYQRKSIRYVGFSLINILLDLASIAYLIPLFIFILDKNQLPDFIKHSFLFTDSYLVYSLLGVLVLFILKNAIQIAIIKFQSNLVFNIATKLATQLTHNFLEGSYLDIQKLDKGKEIQKIQMAATDFANHILGSLNTFVTELTVIIIITIISFIIYPNFSVYIVLIAVLGVGVLYVFRKKKITVLGHAIRQSFSAATSHLLNIIDGFLEIKSLHKESFFQEKYEKKLGDFNANFAALKRHQNASGKFLEISIIIALTLFMLYVNTRFYNGSGKVLLISFVAGISLKLVPSLNKLIVGYTNFKSYQYTIAIFSTIKKSDKTLPKYDFRSTLELQNVSFSYSEKHPLLKGVNLTVSKGKMIGIKGRSGIGKTTLLNIIMGLLHPTEGTVLIDGNPINNTQSILFNFIGYVPQQPFLFQGTLLENIVFDQPTSEIDFDKINTFFEVFELQEFVSKLPNGIHTMLSHDTLQVSGGQKQRIALIRAFYAHPKMLILDEVTNQLDQDLEQKVGAFIKQFTVANNIATLIVSHAPEIHNLCDEVFTISHAKLAPQ